MTEQEIRRAIAAEDDLSPMRALGLHLLDAIEDYPDARAREAREAEVIAVGENRLLAIRRRGEQVARDMVAAEQGARGARMLWEHLRVAEGECEAVFWLSLMEHLDQWEAAFPQTLACYFASGALAAYAARYAEIWRAAKDAP